MQLLIYIYIYIYIYIPTVFFLQLPLYFHCRPCSPALAIICIIFLFQTCFDVQVILMIIISSHDSPMRTKVLQSTAEFMHICQNMELVDNQSLQGWRMVSTTIILPFVVYWYRKITKFAAYSFPRNDTGKWNFFNRFTDRRCQNYVII